MRARKSFLPTFPFLFVAQSITLAIAKCNIVCSTLLATRLQVEFLTFCQSPNKLSMTRAVMLSGLLPQLQCIAANLAKMQPWRLRIGPRCHNPHHNIFFVSTQAPVPPVCCPLLIFTTKVSDFEMLQRVANQLLETCHMTYTCCLSRNHLKLTNGLQRKNNMHTQAKKYY